MHHRAYPGLGHSPPSSPSFSSPVPNAAHPHKHPHPPTSNVFNPKIIDASIRDVTGCLSDEHKADVLLYAMAHLNLDRSRTLIENAVQSCLSLSKLPAANAAKARLIRAKARLAAGMHVGAHQDILAALELQPQNPEASALMAQHVATPGEPLVKPDTTPKFSTEIWREIALWLPPRDLKALLGVPHVLSRIASELLFQRIDMHFSSEKRDSQRSADLLTRIITDATFASHVRTLRVFVPGRETSPMTFHTGMLSNALPKLTNLRNVHCGMRWKDMFAFLRVLETISHRLTGLSLMPSDGTGELRFPRFRHIQQFSYHSTGGATAQVHAFLVQNKPSIRFLSLHNPNWAFPADAISIRNLTHLDFQGLFPVDSRAFTDVLQGGLQLESLRLECILECTASQQFRENPSALPFLRHFAFGLLDYRASDCDLFPAISAFLRGRTNLRSLQLTVPSPDWALQRLGYDASVWGVLPSLLNLRSLTATLPKDVAPPVAMWLVPRGVQALSLQNTTPANPFEFVSQLRAGMPPQLRYIGLSQFRDVEDVAQVVEQGFPMVRVARFDDDFYTVSRQGGKTVLEEWPKGRTLYNARDWLECFGCAEAEWRDPTQFL
ncbi:uncharacterized protein BXZ73DRAFT_93322 [Epithele typhae]|uniref:uncharacterized protein n=1 Tax=Epithele typhae TaxID=378194 RepID=UPI002007AF44|nr:uncharacterized protein BXZ73DRAFT_93322 [Epithele typhae]KAH9911772.1 hypothetical protein BXZ73DRAFT_93322 [Epithele typhae]